MRRDLIKCQLKLCSCWKTVKVTVSMPSGYFGTVVISSSDEGVLSNGGDGVANIGDAAGPEYPTSRSFLVYGEGCRKLHYKGILYSCRRCRGPTMPEV